MCCSCPDFLLVLLSIIFPPLAAMLRRGCGADFLINCGLTMLGYVPGLIHAWYLICKYPAEEYVMFVDEEPRLRHQNPQHVIVISHERTPIAQTPLNAGYSSAQTGATASQGASEMPPPYSPTQENSKSSNV